MPTGDSNIGDSRKIWNSTFKVKKNAKPLKRTPFKSRTSPLKRSGTLRKIRAPLKRARKESKPKLEAWIKAIPESQAHGSGTLQKRLWRLKSDFVRIRDWYAHDGRCVATGIKIGHWSQGQAGHLKPWSKCNGIYKFDTQNIHMQSYISNKYGNADTWYYYELELKKRHEITREDIEERNRLTPLKTLGVQTLKERMRDFLFAMKNLSEQPGYYPRVISLLTQLENVVK